jgi:hypothetical protein
LEIDWEAIHAKIENELEDEKSQGGQIGAGK